MVYTDFVEIRRSGRPNAKVTASNVNLKRAARNSESPSCLIKRQAVDGITDNSARIEKVCEICMVSIEITRGGGEERLGTILSNV